MRGTCFGFEIHSELAFGALRRGTGDVVRMTVVDEPPAPVGQLVREWRQETFCAQIFSDGRAYVFVIHGLGSIAVDPVARTIAGGGIDDPLVLEELLCGVPLALCFLERGDVPLHAAAVEIDGGAVVLAAPGTYGKSTLAAAFAREGHRVLSEDAVCLRPGPSPAVLPGPALIRLRDDVVGRVTVTQAAAVPTADRTRLTFGDERGDGAPVPLRAICFLRTGESTPRLERVPPARALPDLWALSLRLTREDDERCFGGLVDSMKGVPIFDLRRRLRFEELAPTVACVVDAVR